MAAEVTTSIIATPLIEFPWLRVLLLSHLPKQPFAFGIKLFSIKNQHIHVESHKQEGDLTGLCIDNLSRVCYSERKLFQTAAQREHYMAT